MIREYETIEHLLAVLLTSFDIAVAKIWANAAVVLITAPFSMIFRAAGTLDISITGSKVLYLLGTSLFLLAATATGRFLASVARSMAQFALLVMLTVLPMLMMSVGETPVESQPVWLPAATVFYRRATTWLQSRPLPSRVQESKPSGWNSFGWPF